MTTTWSPTTRTLRLSGSSIADWERCRYRWYASHILNRVRPGIESLPALFGQSVHAGLATHYRGQSVHAAEQSLRACWSGVTVPQEEWLTEGRAVEVLHHYLDHARDDAWTVPKFPGTGPLVEHKFCIPLAELSGVQVLWSGYVDLAIESTVAGRLCRAVVDHKTTQRASNHDQLRAKYTLNRAVRGYLWSLEQTTELEFDSAIVNEIIIRPPTSTTRATKPRIECGPETRLTVPFTRESKNQWFCDTCETASEIINALLSKRFPRSLSACTFPSVCAYHPACATCNEQDCTEYLLSGEYVQREHRETEIRNEHQNPK